MCGAGQPQPFQQQPPQTQYGQQQYGQPQHGQPQYAQPYYPRPPSPPGEKMIMISGIIMTVFGAIAVLIVFFLFAAISQMWFIPDYYYLYVSFSMIMATLTLAFGIAGIPFSKRAEKANTIIAFGVTIIALRIIDVILGFVMNSGGADLTMTIVLSLTFGIPLPLLYIIGGNIRKKYA